MVPLMMEEDYKPDGWLGLLLGTRMWYPLYGEVVLRPEVFEERMVALSRDLGTRGQALSADDALRAHHGAVAVVSSSQSSDDLDDRRSELESLKTSQIRKRAVDAGATPADMDAADDSADPKTFWIGMLLSLTASTMQSVQVSDVVALFRSSDGSSTAVSRLGDALERGAEILDSLLVSASRKARRSLQQLLDEVEAEAERAESEGCGQLQHCTVAAVEELAGALIAVESLASWRPDSSVEAWHDVVVSDLTQLLASIGRCGDLVLQSVSVLLSDGVLEADIRLTAIGLLRDLERLPETSAEIELPVVPVLMTMIFDSSSDSRVRETACMALYTMCIRIGRSLNSVGDALEDLVLKAAAEKCALFTDSQTRRLGCYLSAVVTMLFADLASKTGARGPIQNVTMTYFNILFQENKKLSLAGLESVVDASVVAVRSASDDILTMGALALGCDSLMVHSANMGDMAQQRGYFSASATFHRTQVGARLPAKWWADHGSVMTEHTNRVATAFYSFQAFPKAGMKDMCAVAEDWRYVVEESVHLLRTIHDGELTKGVGMFLFPGYWAMTVVEFAANEGQQQLLIESRIPEACMFFIANDFVTIEKTGETETVSVSLGSGAAGIAVSLIGSNESGLTLSQKTVQNVVKVFQRCFDPKQHYFVYPLARVAMYARRVARAAVADANKPFVLQAAGVLNTLVDGLLLEDSNPKKGLEGAAELQQVCAEALQELSLSTVGEAALKADGRAMAALRELRSAGLTAAARQCAAGALFKLEGSRKLAPSGGDSGDKGGSKSGGRGSKSGTSPKHVMISYQCESRCIELASWLAFPAHIFVSPQPCAD